MATAFLSRFQREKSERQVLGENKSNKEKQKNGGSAGFSLSLSRSSAAISAPTKSDVITKTSENVQQPAEQPRQQRRYMRSATAASVTQLLSEGCNSLLQRFRRNPSERPDKSQQKQNR